MKQVRLIRVFISSPGDLTKERQLVADICTQISQDIGYQHSALLEPVRWETHATSGKGKRSQEVISNSIGDYDIYIGLMGFYFGSDTGAYSSGTEEEYEEALSLNSKSAKPLIQFYFSNAKVDLRSVVMDQYARVENFRNKIGSEGVFYRNFSTLDELRSNVRSGLTSAFFEVLKQRDFDKKENKGVERKEDAAHPPSYEALKPYDTLKNLNLEFSNDPSVASHYLLYESTMAFRSMTSRFSAINTKVSEVSKFFGRATQAVSKHNSERGSSQKRVERTAIDAINSFETLCFWLSDEVPRFHEDFSSGLDCLQRCAVIIQTSPEFGDDELRELDETIEMTAKQLEIFASTAVDTGESFPAIDAFGSRWDVNRKIFRATMKDFSELLTSSIGTLRQTAELFRRSDV